MTISGKEQTNMEEEQEKKGVTVVFEGVSPKAAIHLKYLSMLGLLGGCGNNITDGEWLTQVIMDYELPRHWKPSKIKKLEQEFIDYGHLKPQDLKL